MSRYYYPYHRRSLVGDLFLLPFVVAGGIANAACGVFGIGLAISERQYNERNPVSNYKPTGKVYRLSQKASDYIEATVASIPAGQRQRERILMKRYYSQFSESTQISLLKDKVFDVPVEVNVPTISTRLRLEFEDAIKYGNPLREDVQAMINSKVSDLDGLKQSIRRMELVVEYSRLNDAQQQAKVLDFSRPLPMSEVSDSPVGEKKYSTFIGV